MKNSNPEKFARLLWEISQKTMKQQPEGRRVVFLNAWNEWAEGNHLEPDQKYGCTYLEAVRTTKARVAGLVVA